MFMPHAILDMALVWLQPTLSLSSPHFQAHLRLCSTHAFAPAVLLASNARHPISTCWRGVLLPQDPEDFPEDPTSSTMSSPLYAACFCRHLGSHLTAPLPMPCSRSAPKSGRMGTTVGDPPARWEAGVGTGHTGSALGSRAWGWGELKLLGDGEKVCERVQS